MTPRIGMAAFAALVACTPPPAEAPSTTWLSQWPGRYGGVVTRVAIGADGSTLALGDAGPSTGITTTFESTGAAAAAPPAVDPTQWLAKFGPHGELGFAVALKDADRGIGVVHAPDGGMVVVGTVARTQGGRRPEPQDSFDVDGFVARHDASGARVWRHEFTGPLSQAVLEVAAAPGGGTVVAAQVSGDTRYTGDPANEPLSRRGAELRVSTGLVVRLAEDGKLLWTGEASTDALSLAGMAIGPDGSVALTGQCHGPVAVLGGGAERSLECEVDRRPGYVVVWSANGEIRWARRLGSAQTDQTNPLAVTVLDDGDVVMAGLFRGELGGDGLPVLRNTAPGQHDGFVVRLAGLDGAPRWIRHIRGAADELVQAVAPGRDGSVWALVELEGRAEVDDGATYVPIAEVDGVRSALVHYTREGARAHVVPLGALEPRHLATGAGEVLRVVGDFRGWIKVWGPASGPLELATWGEAGILLAAPAPR